MFKVGIDLRRNTVIENLGFGESLCRLNVEDDEFDVRDGDSTL